MDEITTLRLSKINAVAHAQLTFQMLTFLKKYPTGIKDKPI